MKLHMPDLLYTLSSFGQCKCMFCIFPLKDGFSIPLRETLVGARHQKSANYFKLDSTALNTVLFSMSKYLNI